MTLPEQDEIGSPFGSLWASIVGARSIVLTFDFPWSRAVLGRYRCSFHKLMPRTSVSAMLEMGLPSGGLSQRQLLTLLRQSTLHGRENHLNDFYVVAKVDPNAGGAHIITTHPSPAYNMCPYRIWTIFSDFVRVKVSPQVWDPTDPVF